MRCYNILPLMAGFTFNFAPQAVSHGTRLRTPGRGAHNNTPRKKSQNHRPLKKILECQNSRIFMSKSTCTVTK